MLVKRTLKKAAWKSCSHAALNADMIGISGVHEESVVFTWLLAGFELESSVTQVVN